MNKKISFPIAIIIVTICALLVAGLALWQYLKLQKEKLEILEIKLPGKETLSKDKEALKGIAYGLMDEYLSQYKSSDIPLEKRLKSYLIEEISIEPVIEDCFGFGVQYSVETFIMPSDWLAGNGKVSGNWVNHKSQVGEIIKEGDNYKIINMGTARAAPPCSQLEEENETADWEIYKSTLLGFEMKYPPGWFLYKEVHNISTVDPEDYGLPIETLKAKYQETATIWWERTGVQSIDELVAERFSPETNNKITSDFNIKIGNLSVREIIYTCKDCKDIYIPEYDGHTPAKEGRVVFFPVEKDVFYLWLYYSNNASKAEYYIKTFNQILANIRFL